MLGAADGDWEADGAPVVGLALGDAVVKTLLMAVATMKLVLIPVLKLDKKVDFDVAVANIASLVVWLEATKNSKISWPVD